MKAELALMDAYTELAKARRENAELRAAVNATYSNVTRITVVDSEYGRVFERYNLYRNGVELHLQDDGRTLKIFPRTNTPIEEE